eukprot:scaffold194444_cov14-Tisochrysis_lutea.AAC.1
MAKKWPLTTIFLKSVFGMYDGWSCHAGTLACNYLVMQPCNYAAMQSCINCWLFAVKQLCSQSNCCRAIVSCCHANLLSCTSCWLFAVQQSRKLAVMHQSFEATA